MLRFHDILGVIGERFLFLFLLPLFDVPFLMLVCSAQFHDILAVIVECFLIYICYLFPVTDVPFSW